MNLAEGTIQPRKFAEGEENLAIQVTVTFTYQPDLKHYSATDEYPAAENITEAMGIDMRAVRGGDFSVHELVPDDGSAAHIKFEIVDLSGSPDEADKEKLHATPDAGSETKLTHLDSYQLLLAGDEPAGPVQSGYRQAVQDQASLAHPEA